MSTAGSTALPSPQMYGRAASDPPPGLIVTDVDSTLIGEEVIEELAEHAGMRAHVAAITARAMNGEIDFSQSLRERVATLKGVPHSVFAQVLHDLHPTPGAQRLIDAIHAHGGAFGVVSGGFEEVVAPLAQRMNIDFYCANRLEVVGGVLTGRVLGDIVTARKKVEALESWADILGLDLSRTVAIGDGANDLPMMRRAGLGIAFCAKPLVRKQAEYTLDIRRLDVLIPVLGLDKVTEQV